MRKVEVKKLFFAQLKEIFLPKGFKAITAKNFFVGKTNKGFQRPGLTTRKKPVRGTVSPICPWMAMALAAVVDGVLMLIDKVLMVQKSLPPGQFNAAEFPPPTRRRLVPHSAPSLSLKQTHKPPPSTQNTPPVESPYTAA
jgi:hypothetical protein